MNKIGLVFLSLFIILTKASASLWVSQNTWNDDWEKRYSQWIQTSVNPKFLKDHQIATDCADAALTLRWFFARENALPMASSSSSGKLITNQSSSWDGIASDSDWSKDQRFLRAIKDINNDTDSKTLFKDLYPVKLVSKFLVPGTLFVNATQTSGHAEWIARTSFDGLNSPITFFSSTVPQQIREFLIYPFMKVKWPEKNKNGFMKFRWPLLVNGSIQLQSAESMPGYSTEQYELGAAAEQDFDDFVVARLIGHPLDGLRKLQVLTSSLAERIENRIPMVAEGFQVCGGNKCLNKNSESFYNHSTYSRDGEILFLIQGVFDLIYSNRYLLNVDDQMAGQMTLMWSQLQTEITFQIQDKTLNLGQVVTIWNQAQFSSDPNESIEKRWGLSTEN